MAGVYIWINGRWVMLPEDSQTATGQGGEPNNGGTYSPTPTPTNYGDEGSRWSGRNESGTSGGYFGGIIGFFGGLLGGLFGGGDGVGIDPLVLDLDGDGVELSNLEDSNAYFNLRGNEFATHTSWVSSDDGVLALDRNNNGKIDDINEVFGNATQTGFEKLGELDTNLDGVINNQDESFLALKVWQDSNGDGVSQADEFKNAGLLWNNRH